MYFTIHNTKKSKIDSRYNSHFDNYGYAMLFYLLYIYIYIFTLLSPHQPLFLDSLFSLPFLPLPLYLSQSQLSLSHSQPLAMLSTPLEPTKLSVLPTSLFGFWVDFGLFFVVILGWSNFRFLVVLGWFDFGLFGLVMVGWFGVTVASGG